MPHRRRLLLLLLVAAAAVSSRGDGRYDTAMCNPRTCGGVNITYPFYLTDETKPLAGYGNASCGYPRMGIRCDDDRGPLLQLDADVSVVVTAIGVATANVSLSNYLDKSSGGGACPAVEHNVTLSTSQSSWIQIADGSAVDYLDLFSSCAGAPPAGFSPIACSASAADAAPSFVFPEKSVPPWIRALGCKLVRVPVLKLDAAAAAGNSSGLSNDEYSKALRRGFPLAWTAGGAAQVPCSRCENSTGWCGYSNTGEFIGCLCHDGRVSADVCNNNSTAAARPLLQLDADVSVVVTAIAVATANVSLSNYLDKISGGGACPAVEHNMTLSTSQSPWIQIADGSAVDYLDFFSSCAGAPPAGFSPIACSASAAGAAPSFVFPENSVPPWIRALGCKLARVPMLKLDSGAAGNSSGLSSDEYSKTLRRGFPLALTAGGATQEPCRRCENSTGRCGYSNAGEFIGYLCHDGQLTADVCNSSTAAQIGYSRNKRKIYMIAAAGSCSTLLLRLLSLLAYKKYRFRRKSNGTSKMESFLQNNATIHPKRYTYAQVKRMTKSFAEKLGQGGFGVVYRGALADGRPIAVKMIKDYKTDGEDFINEVASISRTSHVNVVTLLGFCLEGSKRALIYDYMPNGSLQRYAFKDNSKGQNTLSWEKLFDIAVGIARGLEYLHRGCNTRIVHFDIKPHNILLDQDFCPKISDFGLAKLCLNNESAISIGGARGTIGYIAPEVFSKQFGAVSSKSDVYSYGMMVLEMVGARDNKNINANSESSTQYFPQWVYDHLDEYCIGASEINGEITETIRKMIVVGLWCIQVSATKRPTMSRVVEMLEGSTSGLELPPQELLS